MPQSGPPRVGLIFALVQRDACFDFLQTSTVVDFLLLPCNFVDVALSSGNEGTAARPSASGRTATNSGSWCTNWVTWWDSGTSTRAQIATNTSTLSGRTS